MAERVSQVRLANEAWEAMLRAEGRLLREFEADPVWDEVTISEYDVLYTLVSQGPADAAGFTIGELADRVALSQPTLSRMVERLVQRGLVSRHRAPDDARRAIVAITDAGYAVQRRVGTAHGAAVARRMTAALSADELTTLRDLARRLVTAHPATD